MLSWRMKISSHSINIWDIVTYVLPSYLVYQAPSYEANFKLLAAVSMMLAHLSMLFMLKLAVHASSRINNTVKRANLGENHARWVKLGSYDGAWYTEYDGTKCALQYLRYWWNETNFSSTITFDRHWFYFLMMSLIQEVGISHLNPGFHPVWVRQNLGQTC